ncbi:MAG: hypothetical protein NVS1B14_07250 [Vulcanimicrobiaceae bacterium]
MNGTPFASACDALAGTPFANIQFLPETTSTNERAAKKLGDAGHAGLTIVTDFQHHGRGRHGRVWIAPPGCALLFSTILPKEIRSANLWCVPFWTGIAVRRALAKHDIETTLQWPNDVLMGGRKLAGILCVSRGQGEAAWVACGVGINTHRASDDAYAEVTPSPAFLEDVTPLERGSLLAAILSEFNAMLPLLDNANAVARLWEQTASLEGTPYRIIIDGEPEPFDAIAQRLGPAGELIVLQDNRERTIALADARVIRA